MTKYLIGKTITTAITASFKVSKIKMLIFFKSIYKIYELTTPKCYHKKTALASAEKQLIFCANQANYRLANQGTRQCCLSKHRALNLLSRRRIIDVFHRTRHRAPLPQTPPKINICAAARRARAKPPAPRIPAHERFSAKQNPNHWKNPTGDPTLKRDKILKPPTAPEAAILKSMNHES